MRRPQGKVYYLALGLEYLKGASADTSPIKSLSLYKESSEYDEASFVKATLDTAKDQYLGDLSGLLPSTESIAPDTPVTIGGAEVAICLANFLSLTGLGLSDSLLMQVSTQESGKATYTSSPAVVTQFRFDQVVAPPTLKVLLNSKRRATLKCLAPEGVEVGNYTYGLRSLLTKDFGKKGTKTFSTKSRTRRTVLPGGQYLARCKYEKTDGER